MRRGLSLNDDIAIGAAMLISLSMALRPSAILAARMVALLVRTKIARNWERARTDAEHHRVQYTQLCVRESAMGAGGVPTRSETEYHAERRRFGTRMAPASRARSRVDETQRTANR